MNRRFIFGFLLGVAALGGAFLRGAMAAPAAPAIDPGIPASYKSDSDPSAHGDEIVSKVNAEIDKLCDPANSAMQGSARDWLLAELLLNNTPASTSIGYLDLYTSTLNKAFVSRMQKSDTPVRVKLNIAIIAVKASEGSGNANLFPTVMACLDDKSDAVGLWAEKAAGAILPAVFKYGTGNSSGQLLDAMVKCVQNHTTPPLAGWIAEEAYKGLNLKARGVAPTAPAAAAIINAVLQLQDTRLRLYIKGVPDLPDADTPGSLILLDSGTWSNLTDAQKTHAVQIASDLITLAGKRASERSVNEADPFIRTINHEGYVLMTLASGALHDADLENVMQAVYKLPIGTPGAGVDQVCQSAYPALQKVFSTLKPAPEIVPSSKSGK